MFVEILYMKIFNYVKGLFSPCKHEKNYRSKKYYSNDGTPMVHFECYDCGYIDAGHVYTNEWEGRLVVKKDGRTVIDCPVRQNITPKHIEPIH